MFREPANPFLCAALLFVILLVIHLGTSAALEAGWLG